MDGVSHEPSAIIGSPLRMAYEIAKAETDAKHRAFLEIQSEYIGRRNLWQAAEFRSDQAYDAWVRALYAERAAAP